MAGGHLDWEEVDEDLWALFGLPPGKPLPNLLRVKEESDDRESYLPHSPEYLGALQVAAGDESFFGLSSSSIRPTQPVQLNTPAELYQFVLKHSPFANRSLLSQYEQVLQRTEPLAIAKVLQKIQELKMQQVLQRTEPLAIEIDRLESVVGGIDSTVNLQIRQIYIQALQQLHPDQSLVVSQSGHRHQASLLPSVSLYGHGAQYTRNTRNTRTSVSSLMTFSIAGSPNEGHPPPGALTNASGAPVNQFRSGQGFG